MDAIVAEDVVAGCEDGLTKDVQADCTDVIVVWRGYEVVHGEARRRRRRRAYSSNFAADCCCSWLDVGCEGGSIVDDKDRTEGVGREGGRRLVRGWGDEGR